MKVNARNLVLIVLPRQTADLLQYSLQGIHLGLADPDHIL